VLGVWIEGRWFGREGIENGCRGSGEGIRVNGEWGCGGGGVKTGVFRVDGRPLNWSADVIVFL